MANNDITGHMRFLSEVCMHDVEILVEKEAKYKGSWKKRGGVGAFMMLARKWDRIENQLEEVGYDVFKLCQDDKDFRENEIGDLRRYLMLVEAELLNLEKEHSVDRTFSRSRQCQECGEYYYGPHICEGECKCCTCYCPIHEDECNSQHVKEEIRKRSEKRIKGDGENLGAKLEMKDVLSPELERMKTVNCRCATGLVEDGPVVYEKHESVIQTSPLEKNRGAPGEVQCQECGEYYFEEHRCKGKCACCGLFELECFCSTHHPKCNSQFVKKKEDKKE